MRWCRGRRVMVAIEVSQTVLQEAETHTASVWTEPSYRFHLPHECSSKKTSGWWYGLLVTWQVYGAQGMHKDSQARLKLSHTVSTAALILPQVQDNQCFLPRSILWFTFHTGLQRLLSVKGVIKPKVELSPKTDLKMPDRCWSRWCSTNCHPNSFRPLGRESKTKTRSSCKA